MKLYETLEIKIDANNKEIEKSYKKLIYNVHPNRNSSCVTKYLEVNFAYKILKDKYKRDFYDTFGDKSLKILENDKEGFIWSRCLNRKNLLIITIVAITAFFNLMFLPIYVYLNKTDKSYSFYILPCFISSLLLSIAVYRAYKSINRVVVRIFYMFTIVVYWFIMTFEMLAICLYCDGFVNFYVVTISLLAFLEIMSVCFWIYKVRKIQKYNGHIYQPVIFRLSLYEEVIVILKRYF